MAIAGLNPLPDAGFFFMRQALVEARLISGKRGCDAVYVATLAEELRNIEKKVAAFEESRGLTTDVSSAQLEPPPAAEDLPDVEWIHRKACELDRRLRSVEQSWQQNSGWIGDARVPTTWRAVPRYPRVKEDQ